MLARDRLWVRLSLSGGLINAARVLSAKLSDAGVVKVAGEIKCEARYSLNTGVLASLAILLAAASVESPAMTAPVSE